MKKLFINALTILLLTISFSALCETSPTKLVGVITHAGYQDETGIWHIFGCPDHGETDLDGRNDLLQVELNSHLTIALHADGMLSFPGITTLPVDAISSWSGIQEFACYQGFPNKRNEILFAMKSDGRILVGHNLPDELHLDNVLLSHSLN